MYQILNLYLHPPQKCDRRYIMWKMGWFEVVRVRSRSLEIAPFDTTHTSSCQRSILTMSLSCTVSEMQRDIGRKLLIWN